MYRFRTLIAAVSICSLLCSDWIVGLHVAGVGVCCRGHHASSHADPTGADTASSEGGMRGDAAGQSSSQRKDSQSCAKRLNSVCSCQHSDNPDSCSRIDPASACSPDDSPCRQEHDSESCVLCRAAIANQSCNLIEVAFLFADQFVLVEPSQQYRSPLLEVFLLPQASRRGPPSSHLA